MAYTLKTTGIAANCTMCIAVDPDTTTIKDFASAAVTADMTVGANVTIATQAWDGITRSYWTLGAGTTAADFIAFGATKPRYTNNVSGTQRTIVFIGEVAGSAARVIGADSDTYVCSQNTASGGASFPTISSMGYAASATGGAAALVAGNKRIFGFSLVHSTSGVAYWAADTDAAMSSAVLAAPTNTSATENANNFDIAYVGRRNDATTHQQDKVHAILLFDTSLTEAQWDSMRDDWFGTLFEASTVSSDVIVVCMG